MAALGRYDDGDEERSVPASRIRLVSRAIRVNNAVSQVLERNYYYQYPKSHGWVTLTSLGLQLKVNDVVAALWQQPGQEGWYKGKVGTKGRGL